MTRLEPPPQTGSHHTPVSPPETGPTPPPSVAADTVPSRKRSITRAAWLALVIGVVVLVFMLIFILQNNSPAQFTLLAWSFTTPMGVAMLFAAIAGALITAMVGTIRMIVLGRNVRQLQRERTAGARGA